MASSNSKIPTELCTPRLRLRRWRPADLVPFADLNADPRVMEYFPSTLTRTESDERAARVEAHFQEHGFGLWAVEVPGISAFAGFVGLARTPFSAHFTPCLELAWRLAYDHWGQGFATEAARYALSAVRTWRPDEPIVSFTVPANIRSRRVMEKLGMTHSSADDFDHPLLPRDHPLSRHVLYRLPNRESELVAVIATTAKYGIEHSS